MTFPASVLSSGNPWPMIRFYLSISASHSVMFPLRRYTARLTFATTYRANRTIALLSLEASRLDQENYERRKS
jgi:hypothetical protein